MAQTSTVYAQCTAMLALLEGADSPLVEAQLVRVRARLRGALEAANYAPDAADALIAPAPATPVQVPAQPAPAQDAERKVRERMIAGEAVGRNERKPAPAPATDGAKPVSIVKRKIRVGSALKRAHEAGAITEARVREVNRLAGRDIDAAEAIVASLTGAPAPVIAQPTPAPAQNGAVAPEFVDLA